MTHNPVTKRKVQLRIRFTCSADTTQTKETNAMTTLFIYAIISFAGCAYMGAMDLFARNYTR
jgi:hypothetical protein